MFLAINIAIFLNFFFFTGLTSNYLYPENHYRFEGQHNGFLGSLKNDCSPLAITHFKFNLYPVIEECYWSRYTENNELPTPSEEYFLKMIYGNLTTYSNFGRFPFHINKINIENSIVIHQTFVEGLIKSRDKRKHNKKFFLEISKGFEVSYNDSLKITRKEFVERIHNYYYGKRAWIRVKNWLEDSSSEDIRKSAISIEELKILKERVQNSGKSTLFHIENDIPEYKIVGFSVAVIQALYAPTQIYQLITSMMEDNQRKKLTLFKSTL